MIKRNCPTFLKIVLIINEINKFIKMLIIRLNKLFFNVSKTFIKLHCQNNRFFHLYIVSEGINTIINDILCFQGLQQLTS